MREVLDYDRKLDGRLWLHPAGPLHPVHRHDDLEFVLTVRGSAVFVVGQQRHDLAPGSLIWLFPAQDHQLIGMSRDYAGWIEVVRPRTAAALARDARYRGLAAADPPGSWARSLGRDDRLLLERVLADLAAQGEAPTRLNPGVRYALCLAWDAFHRAGPAPDRLLHPGVAAACAALGRDPSASLDRVARAAGLSLSRLEHLFRDQLGTTLTAHRGRLRVERFQALAVEHPQRTALSLALDAGFGSYPQFHRVFSRVCGRSPAAWLKDQTPRS